MRNSQKRLFADLKLIDNDHFIDSCKYSNKMHFTRKRKMPLKNLLLSIPFRKGKTLYFELKKGGVSMGKHKNGKQISVWISDELYKECEQNRIRGEKKINKTDYVTAALEFYNRHIKDETTMEYVSDKVLGELYEKMQSMEDNICKKITTSVIEPDKMRVVLKMSYGIEWEDFLEKYLIICK